MSDEMEKWTGQFYFWFIALGIPLAFAVGWFFQ